LKGKTLFTILALSVLLLSLTVLASPSIEPPFDQPRFDEIWYKVILDPSTAIADLKDGKLDYLPDVPTYEDLEDLQNLGFNWSRAEMAEFAWFGFNCRDYTPDYAPNPGVPLEPLNFSAWRTAMHYAIGHEEKARITSEVLGPVSYALDSIIPPAQAEWHNPDIYVPKDWDFANETLYDAGFYVSDGKLYNPDGTEVRTIELLYSSGIPILKTLIEEYAKVWNQFFEWMGVTAAGGGGYLEYPIKPTPMSFGSIVMKILSSHDFDMITLGWTNLGRFADWTYDLFHSRFAVPWAYNFGGFKNDTCDELVETIKFSLNRTEVKEAAYKFQELFAYEWNPYIVRSSGYQHSIFGRRDPTTGEIRRLRNWLAMPSYGADVDWTWALMHWEDNPEGTGDYVNRRISEAPSELHPWYADEVYEWDILDRTVGGLLNLNPFTLEDIPWIACDWEVEYWEAGEVPPEVKEALGIVKGMKVTFYLRQDVYWQNGDPLTAEDVKMNWDMLREWKPGRYSTMWENLIYTEIPAPYVVTAYINQTSLTTLYDFAGTALFFPKRILQELEARLHDVSDPWYHNPRAFRPWEEDYTAFFQHTVIPVDPDPVDERFSPIYEGMDISGNIGHDPSGPFAEPENMVEEYKCIIGVNPYIYDYWHPAENMAHSVKYPMFWWDCPVEQNFIAPTRVEPGEDFPFWIEVSNYGAKAGGEFVPVVLDYINLTVDGEVVETIPGPITIPPFGSVIIGGDYTVVNFTDYKAGTVPPPFTGNFPEGGLHYLDCVCVEEGEPLECSYYEHYIWVTLETDLYPYDFKVDMIDLWLCAKAFGSFPVHPRWNPVCDVDHNFKVDMIDLWRIAKDFGWVA